MKFAEVIVNSRSLKEPIDRIIQQDPTVHQRDLDDNSSLYNRCLDELLNYYSRSADKDTPRPISQSYESYINAMLEETGKLVEGVNSTSFNQFLKVINGFRSEKVSRKKMNDAGTINSNSYREFERKTYNEPTHFYTPPVEVTVPADE